MHKANSLKLLLLLPVKPPRGAVDREFVPCAEFTMYWDRGA